MPIPIIVIDNTRYKTGVTASPLYMAKTGRKIVTVESKRHQTLEEHVLYQSHLTDLYLLFKM